MAKQTSQYKTTWTAIQTALTYGQRCGLSREVSISRRSRDILTSRLEQNPQHLGLVSVLEQYISVSAK